MGNTEGRAATDLYQDFRLVIKIFESTEQRHLPASRLRFESNPYPFVILQRPYQDSGHVLDCSVRRQLYPSVPSPNLISVRNRSLRQSLNSQIIELLLSKEPQPGVEILDESGLILERGQLAREIDPLSPCPRVSRAHHELPRSLPADTA
jgi:hypothetical protein